MSTFTQIIAPWGCVYGIGVIGRTLPITQGRVQPSKIAARWASGSMRCLSYEAA